jgi:hypothetical protein
MPVSIDLEIEMNANNHQLHEPTYTGEVKADGQFTVF